MLKRAPCGASPRRALSTPEPLVRAFARRVQQEGALDLTQGDYKNADFAPHPEVVRAAQRITRNTVHSYGPAVGRMDVRERDRRVLQPRRAPRLPLLRRPVPARRGPVHARRRGRVWRWCSRCWARTARASSSRGRAGSTTGSSSGPASTSWSCPTDAARVPARPGGARPAPRGGRDLLGHPEQPAQPDRPRVSRARSSRSSSASRRRAPGLRALRLGLPAPRLPRLLRQPGLREPGVARLGRHAVGPLEDGHVRGLDRRARLLDRALRPDPRRRGVRAREILANLSAWLVATPSTLAQDWALAALQSPLAALRRPSPYMRERRDFMIGGRGRARAPRRRAHRLRRARSTRRSRSRASSASRSSGCATASGSGPSCATRSTRSSSCSRVASAASRSPRSPAAEAARYGTWQRLSYGSKDVHELAVFIDRVRTRDRSTARAGSSAPAAPAAAGDGRGRRCGRASAPRIGYDALDGLDPRAFAEARAPFLERPPPEALRLTGTKHPDSTGAPGRAARARARAAPDGTPDRADRGADAPRVEPARRRAARVRGDRSRDLLGPCIEVLLDYEGRQISPDWLDVPEKVVLALLRHGVIPGEDRHLLFRVPNPWIEQDEEKISKILASVARANVLFLLACERLGIEPKQNAIYELSVPQVNSARGDRRGREDRLALPRGASPASSTGGPSASTRSCRRASRRRGAPELVARGLARAPRAARRERRRPRAPPDFLEAYVPGARAQPRRRGPPDAGQLPDAVRRGRDPSSACSSRCPTPPSRAGRSRRTPRTRSRSPGARRPSAGSPSARGGSARAPPRVTFLVGAGRAGFRGGFDPEHEGVIAQFARADGVTLQGIRADAPAEAARLAARSARRPRRRTPRPGRRRRGDGSPCSRSSRRA